MSNNNSQSAWARIGAHQSWPTPRTGPRGPLQPATRFSPGSRTRSTLGESYHPKNGPVGPPTPARRTSPGSLSSQLRLDAAPRPDEKPSTSSTKPSLYAAPRWTRVLTRLVGVRCDDLKRTARLGRAIRVDRHDD